MKDFEKDYFTQLETRFPDLLKGLKNPMTDEVEKQIQGIAADVALTFAH
jgi:hypothetical protein